jgi:hypothetical protein
MSIVGQDFGRQPETALGYRPPELRSSAASAIAPDGLARPLWLHRHFVLFSASMYSLLIAEAGWYSGVRYGGHLATQQVLARVAVNGLAAFAGYVLAFAAAPRLYQRLARMPGERMVVQLMTQWAWIAAILGMFGLCAALWYLPLVSGSLIGTFLLLRSCALSTLLVSVTAPGMVLFVIYVRYLREQGLDDGYKVFGVCATLALLLLMISMRFLNFDARPDLSDIALIDSIHYNASSVLLVVTLLSTYFLALRWIADH